MKPANYLIPLAMAGLLSACGSDSDKKSASSSSSSLSSSSLSSSSLSSSSVPSSSSDASSSSSAAPLWSSIRLEFLGRYASGEFGVSAAEIPAFDPATKRGFVVNARAGVVDVLDLSDPATPKHIGTLAATHIAPGVVVNSVAVHNGLVALAVEAPVKTDTGYVALFKANDLSAPLGHVAVGALPDMLTFTPDGKYILVANEGEPSNDYSIDPEGSVSIIDIGDVTNLKVTLAGFTAFNDKADELRAKGVRIYGPNATVAQDVEPEYIAVSADSSTAWVVLQENNALAKLDIASATITDILPLGFKDHGLDGNGLDASDTDGAIDIKTWPGLYGMYQPDAINAFEVNGETFLITANEGDARAWGEDDDAYWAGDASKGFVEEFRLKHLVHKNGFDRRAGDDLPPQLRELAAGALLNPEVFGHCGAVAGDAKDCREDDFLGRLNITWTMGYRTQEDGSPVLFNKNGVEDAEGDRLMYDKLYSYGARSIAIWNANGGLVWDSGDAIEQFIASDACKLGAARSIDCKTYFNSNHEEGSTFDNRSDNKGPEPEGLTVASIHGKTYVFVGLERMGGVLVYDISNPQAPVFTDYLNTREDWTTEDPSSVLSAVGDLGPEGLAFISADNSPTGEPLLMVGNEVSGTTSLYTIKGIEAAAE